MYEFMSHLRRCMKNISNFKMEIINFNIKWHGE